MKSILMSIQPKWCELIVSGQKTIEVRKTAPKEVPFKVYIYCTYGRGKGESALYFDAYGNVSRKANGVKWINGKVIGEFICNKVSVYDSAFYEWASSVAPSDVYCTIEGLSDSQFYKLAENEAKLTNDDIINYFGDEDFVASLLHISDLKIYDTPKELSEFKGYCNKKEKCYKDIVRHCNDMHFDLKCNSITRPPQSWQYIQELED